MISTRSGPVGTCWGGSACSSARRPTSCSSWRWPAKSVSHPLARSTPELAALRRLIRVCGLLQCTRIFPRRQRRGIATCALGLPTAGLCPAGAADGLGPAECQPLALAASGPATSPRPAGRALAVLRPGQTPVEAVLPDRVPRPRQSCGRAWIRSRAGDDTASRHPRAGGDPSIQLASSPRPYWVFSYLFGSKSPLR